MILVHSLSILFVVPDECKEELVVPKDDHVIIQSPNYPKNYPDNKRCIWNLRNSDPFKSLTMTFIDLDTEEANDIIEVRDGKEKDYVLGQFSGSKDVKFIQPIFSTTKGLWVKFQSNFVNSKRGFKALIRAGNAKTYLEPSRTPTMELFTKINYFRKSFLS